MKIKKSLSLLASMLLSAADTYLLGHYAHWWGLALAVPTVVLISTGCCWWIDYLQDRAGVAAMREQCHQIDSLLELQRRYQQKREEASSCQR